MKCRITSSYSINHFIISHFWKGKWIKNIGLNYDRLVECIIQQFLCDLKLAAEPTFTVQIPLLACVNMKDSQNPEEFVSLIAGAPEAASEGLAPL